MSRMFRGLLPLVLAVIVGATPIAREICELSCADATTPGHARHHQGAANAGSSAGTDVHAGAMAGHHHHTSVATSRNAHAFVTTCGQLSPAAVEPCDRENESQVAAPASVKVVFDQPALLLDGIGAACPPGASTAFASKRVVVYAAIPLALRTSLRV